MNYERYWLKTEGQNLFFCENPGRPEAKTADMLLVPLSQVW